MNPVEEFHSLRLNLLCVLMNRTQDHNTEMTRNVAMNNKGDGWAGLSLEDLTRWCWCPLQFWDLPGQMSHFEFLDTASGESVCLYQSPIAP